MIISDDKNMITMDDGTVLQFEARLHASCGGCYFHAGQFKCDCIAAPCTPMSRNGRDDTLIGIFKEAT